MKNLDRFLATGRWWLNKNGYMDVNGEHVSTCGWRGYRDLNPILRYQINILGHHPRNSFGCKPYRWHAKLVFNGLSFEVPTTHPSCKSLKDACYQADRFLTPTVFRNACEWFYGMRHAECVLYEGTPYFTSFGTFKTAIRYMSGKSKKLHPYGIYNVARRNFKWTKGGYVEVEPRFREIEFGWMCTVGRGDGEPFEHWLPPVT